MSKAAQLKRTAKKKDFFTGFFWESFSEQLVCRIPHRGAIVFSQKSFIVDVRLGSKYAPASGLLLLQINSTINQVMLKF